MTAAQIAEAEKQAVIDEAAHAVWTVPSRTSSTRRNFFDRWPTKATPKLSIIWGATIINSPQNAVEAVKWYKRAADQGYAPAQYSLGEAYKNGVGLLRDIVIAHMWLNFAAPGGNQYAVEARDELEKRMTPAQIAEAEKLAREWKPKPER